MPPCTCRPCDRWCRVARRLQSTMRNAQLDVDMANEAGRPDKAEKAQRTFDLAQKMLRGHLAAVGKAA